MQVGRRRGDALVVSITTQPGVGKRGSAWHRVCFGVKWCRCVTDVTALEEEKVSAPNEVKRAAGESAGRDSAGRRGAGQQHGSAALELVHTDITTYITI